MKKPWGGLLGLFIFFPLLLPQESQPARPLRSGNIVGDIGIQKIPFTLFGHKIYLKIRINESRELDFVLDTGALTAVDREIARELGLEEGPALPSITKSGKVSFSRRPVTFRMGDLAVGDFAPVIADLPEKGEGDPPLDGFIGADMLKFFCVVLDYDAGEIIVSTTPPEPRPPQRPVSMRKQMPMGFPLVDGLVNEKRKISMMIDTGSPFLIVCPLTLIENETTFSDSTIMKSFGTFMTWPGTTAKNNYRARAETLRIGDFVIKNIAVDFAELPGPFSFSLLGYGFLKHFVTILDFPRDTLVLVPKPGGFPEAPASSGMAARKQEGRLIVRGIWPGSPAYRSGIRVGDEIVKINGKNAAQLSTREIEGFLSNDISEGLEIELAAGDGIKKVRLKIGQRP